MKKTVIENIKSPLSVIAIFAGISEIAMTVTLLQLNDESQRIFIWFVMLFPVLLVVAFFFVLYTKPAVLFSPADYQEDATYLKSIGNAKNMDQLALRIEQLEEASKTLQSYIDKVVENTIPDQSNAIIEAERKKLDEVRSIHLLEKNNLYNFLSRELIMGHDDIRMAITQTTSAYELPETITKVTKDNAKASRLDRILKGFPQILNDFDQLKTMLNS